MRKFTFSFKSLLVAAGLLLGSANAWAGVKSTIYEKAVEDWSASDIVTTETAGKWLTSTSGDGNRGLFIVADKGLMTRTRGKTNIDTGTLLLSRTANTIVTFDAVWNVGDSQGSSGHVQGYNQFCSIQYGDLLVRCCLDNRSTDYSYTIKGVKTSLGAAAGTLLNTDLTIHIVVNSTTNEISEFYIKNGETTLAQFSDLTDANNAFTAGTNYDKVITKSDISGVSSTNDFNYLKSITVQQETQSVPTANVTFKYEDTEGNSLSAYKADQVASDVALGTEISTLVPSYNATFYNGDANKYVFNNYVVTGSYTTVQEGGNTVTMKFTNYPATAYTVKAQVSGSDLTTLASGTAYLDGSTSVFWNKYINESGSWYKADETTFGTAITNATNNVAFTATDVVSYFFEAESMALSREYGSFSNNSDYSGGGGKGVYASATLTSTSKVPAGVYTFSIGSVTRTTDKTQSYKVSYSANGSDFVETGKTISFTTAAGSSEQSVAEVIVPAEAYIRLTEGTGGNAFDYVDYVILKKTGEVLTSSANLQGYKTFYNAGSNYQVDENTTIYKAAAPSEGKVVLTDVGGNKIIEAGQAVILKTTNAPGYTIALTATETASTGNFEGNELKVAAGTESGKYVLGYTEANDFGFYYYTATLPAGYIYLDGDAPTPGVKALNVVVDGTATGVEAPEVTEAEEEEVLYNTAGVRVGKDYKGIVINQKGEKRLQK